MMCRRFVEQRCAIDQYAFDKRNFTFTLNTEEWKLVEELVKVLEPIEEISKHFCESLLSVCLPYSITLYRALSVMKLEKDEINNVRKRIMDGIAKRFFPKKEDK